MFSNDASKRKTRKEVWLVLGPHHGDSHTLGSRCSVQDPMEAKMSRGHHGCPGRVG